MTNKDINLLNAALEIEYVAIASYEGAVQLGLLTGKSAEMARIFQGHHGHHVAKIKEAIKKLGGEPAKRLSNEEYLSKMPKDKLSDEESAIHFAIKLEKEAAILALQAVGQLEDKELAMVSASISGDEAMHWAALRKALGLFPVPVSFIPFSLQDQDYENEMGEEEIEEGKKAGKGEDIDEGRQMKKMKERE
jgi:hypothetical protein